MNFLDLIFILFSSIDFLAEGGLVAGVVFTSNYSEISVVL